MFFFNSIKSCASALGDFLRPAIDTTTNIGKRIGHATKKMFSYCIPGFADVSISTSFAYFLLVTLNFNFNWDYPAGFGYTVTAIIGSLSITHYIYQQYHPTSRSKEIVARLRTGFRSGLTTISVMATLGYSQELTLLQDAGFTIIAFGLTFANSIYQAKIGRAHV